MELKLSQRTLILNNNSPKLVEENKKINLKMFKVIILILNIIMKIPI